MDFSILVIDEKEVEIVDLTFKPESKIEEWR